MSISCRMHAMLAASIHCADSAVGLHGTCNLVVQAVVQGAFTLYISHARAMLPRSVCICAEFVAKDAAVMECL